MSNTLATAINDGCSSAHKALLIVAFFYVLFQHYVPQYWLVVSAVPVVLFIYYAWKRVATILITAAIAALLVAVMPFLAPIAFIIMVIIFFARLGYIIENWRAVVAGFYMYGVAGLYGTMAYDQAEHNAYLYDKPSMMMGLINAAIITFLFHRIMVWLYENGYTTRTALPIMGIAPLLIMLLFMPFIKAFDGFDVGADTVDTVDTVDAVDPTTHATETPISTDNPGYHHTSDYYRTAADGSVQHVRGYVATNPDGIVENNLSYRGVSMVDNSTTIGEATVITHPDSNNHSLEFEGADAGRSPRKNEEKDN